MNRRTILFWVLQLTGFVGFGQTTFQKTVGISTTLIGYNSTHTNDGGYVLCGMVEDTSLGYSYTIESLVKLNGNGDTIWTRKFNDTLATEATGIKQTFDNGFVIVGCIAGTMQPLNMVHNPDILLQKADSLGHIQWSRKIDGLSDTYGCDVLQTPDSGFAILGRTENIGGPSDYYLVRTDKSGNVQFANSYGNMGNDIPETFQQTSDGGFIIGGTSDSFSSSLDIYIVKTDSLGIIQWSQSFNSQQTNRLKHIIQTQDGGYMIAGGTYTPGTGSLLLMRLNSLGQIVWAKNYGNSNKLLCEYIVPVFNGYVVAANVPGTGIGDMAIIKVDTSGNFIWGKQFNHGYLERVHLMHKTIDGGFAVIGTAGYAPICCGMLYLVKTDYGGNSWCNDTLFVLPVTTVTISVTNPNTIVTAGYSNTTYTFIETNSPFVDSLICFSPNTVEEIIAKNDFTLYPNPANDNITLELDELFTGNIMLYDVQGKIIYQTNVKNEISHTLNVQYFQPGYYVIRLVNEKQSVAVPLIINGN